MTRAFARKYALRYLNISISIFIAIFVFIEIGFNFNYLKFFDLPCEMSPTINDCIPTNKATSPQKVGLINLNKTGTEIIDINFGNILLIR